MRRVRDYIDAHLSESIELVELSGIAGLSMLRFARQVKHSEGITPHHAAPLFHIAGFPVMFAAPAYGAAQVAIPRFTPQDFCQTVERARVSQTVLVPTMINLLTQFPELEKYDLTSLDEIAYGGSPMAPELIRRP